MNTITIKSNKPDDIYFLNELARRLNLETDIKTDDDYQGKGKLKPVRNTDSEKEKVLKELSDAFREVKLAQE